MDQTPSGTTPAKAATLPVVEPVKTQPSSSATPAEEGKVTITTKEFVELQRAKARAMSFDKRAALTRSPNNAPRTANNEPADATQQALLDEQARADAAERRALQSEVRDSVREVLAKPEYANIPASTRDLILKNPQMLSDADNLEEAMLDIEDFLIDQSSKIEAGGDNIPVVVRGADGGTRPAAASTHETPPTSASGAATPSGGEIEDTSKLTGPARSRAVLRNAIRAGKTGAQK